jgi:hypothetical protein
MSANNQPKLSDLHVPELVQHHGRLQALNPYELKGQEFLMNIFSVKAVPALPAIFPRSIGTKTFVVHLHQLRALTTFLGLATIAMSLFAQTPPSPDFGPPTVDMVDAVGVSMNSGRPNFNIAPLAIGAKGDELRFFESYSGSIQNSPEFRTSALIGTVYGSKIGSIYGTGFMVVNIFGNAEIMQPTGDGVHWSSKSQRGGALSITSAGQVFTYQYVDRTGAIYDFSMGGDPSTCADRTVVTSNAIYEISAYDARCALLSKVTYPDGRTLTLGFPTVDLTDATHYVQKFTRSDGFQLIAEYRVATGSHVDPENVPEPFRVTAYNMAFDYCDVSTIACAFTRAWPYATYTWTGQEVNLNDRMQLTVQDAAGGQTRYTEELEQGYNRDPIANIPYLYSMVIGVKPPSSPINDTITYQYKNQAFCYTFQSGINSITTDCSTYQRDVLVQQATNSAGTWTYSYTHDAPMASAGSRAPGLYTTTMTRPDGFATTGQYNSLTGYIQYVNGSHGNVVYLIDYLNVPNSITRSADSEGRQYIYSFDGRGNLQSRRQVVSGQSINVGPLYQASFPTSCAHPTSCNKPTWIQDPNINQTDYTYDPVHGGVVTETLPPDSNGIRPQKRYTYVQRTPWLKNSSNGYSPGSPIWKLNSVSYCRTGNAAASGVGCAVPNDEVLTTYDYGPDSGPNNLLLRGTVMAADGATHRTCYANDAYGNKISETSANAGLTSCP